MRLMRDDRPGIGQERRLRLIGPDDGVRTARFEHPQDGDQHIGRPQGAYGDEATGRQPQGLDEMPGQPVGPCVQLPVAQPGAVGDHGGTVRLDPHPVLEQLVKRSP
jgi:hypothetical protein